MCPRSPAGPIAANSASPQAARSRRRDRRTRVVMQRVYGAARDVQPKEEEGGSWLSSSFPPPGVKEASLLSNTHGDSTPPRRARADLRPAEWGHRAPQVATSVSQSYGVSNSPNSWNVNAQQLLVEFTPRTRYGSAHGVGHRPPAPGHVLQRQHVQQVTHGVQQETRRTSAETGPAVVDTVMR